MRKRGDAGQQFLCRRAVSLPLSLALPRCNKPRVDHLYPLRGLAAFLDDELHLLLNFVNAALNGPDALFKHCAHALVGHLQANGLQLLFRTGEPTASLFRRCCCPRGDFLA